MAARRGRLAKRRKSQGFSQESLAERLEVDEKTIRRWERGESEPQPWLRPKLAQCLQVSPERLDELLAYGDDEQEIDERVGHALAHPGSTDLVTVARLREQVHGLDAQYDRAPSTSLLAETGQCLGQVSFLRAHAPSHRVRRELYAVETESATLMGQLVWDASQRRDHRTAYGYFDQAVTAARELQDPTAEGLALLRRSFVALYGEKDATKGLTLTMQAAETTKASSHVLAGLAALHAAEAHAMLGAQSDCERALGDAERTFDQINDADAALDLSLRPSPAAWRARVTSFSGVRSGLNPSWRRRPASCATAPRATPLCSATSPWRTSGKASWTRPSPCFTRRWR